ncbi:YqjF family protein [Salibacterium aidingense]|uniref:YqjF family protein n=1 Tax=Salibacterium aidingense TaxID=384933 RepID=UPI0004176DCA|nr:DUF2071 domain-containing protein [Salibacterium aidingense]
MPERQKPTWIARQTWEDLLFIHWAVNVEDLRPHIPDFLDIETFNGKAWIGVVPFQASENRLRGMSRPLPFSTFLELNVRTYVSYRGEPGVYFLTMDANHRLAVTGARHLIGLPYFMADMTLKKESDTILFSSKRKHSGVIPAFFSARYLPYSKPGLSAKESLTTWLTERYCLWKVIRNKVFKRPIYHEPWELQEAGLVITTDKLLDFLPASAFQEDPLVHYAAAKTVYFFPIERK